MRYQFLKLIFSLRKSPKTEQGSIIVEAVVSMLVLSLGLIGLLPLITISVASRVQSQRVELAVNAARTYIENLRAETIVPPSLTTAKLNTVAGPSGNVLNCQANSYCLSPTVANSALYCVDGDIDGICSNTSSKDMLVQAFAANTATGATVADGYSVGVRVYRANAFTGNQVFLASFSGKAAQRTFGTVNSSGGEPPLYELTTEIATAATNYQALCARVDTLTSITGCQ
ncbi:MAG: hormogonium polysaccharide secretion pseudopilin HpsB [Cyanobacteria bacterium P01_H01_bin.15]